MKNNIADHKNSIVTATVWNQTNTTLTDEPHVRTDYTETQIASPK